MKQLGNVKHVITIIIQFCFIEVGVRYFNLCRLIFFLYSALDAESERVVQDALDKVTKGKREVWVKRRELTLLTVYSG